jgi:hypothetical protein
LGNATATELDGVDEYISAPDSLSLDITGDITVSLWIKFITMNGSGDFPHLISKNGPVVSNGYAMYLVGNNTPSNAYVVWTATLNGGEGATTDNGDRPTTGVWYHYVGVHRSGTSYLYRDNVEKDTQSQPSGVSSSSLELIMGTHWDRPDLYGYLNCIYDEVTVWDHGMTAGEVSELYNSGCPADPTTHSQSSNLAAWWRMGDGDTHPTLTDNSTNSNDGTITNGESGDFVSDTPC